MKEPLSVPIGIMYDLQARLGESQGEVMDAQARERSLESRLQADRSHLLHHIDRAISDLEAGKVTPAQALEVIRGLRSYLETRLALSRL